MSSLKPQESDSIHSLHTPTTSSVPNPSVPFKLFPIIERRRELRWVVGLALCGSLLAIDAWLRPTAPAPAKAVQPVVKVAPDSQLFLKSAGRIPMPEGVPAAHASALLALPADDPAALLACWFAGTRESAPDVQIFCSRFDRAEQSWTAATEVVNRRSVAKDLDFGLRRLGNPVAWRDARGRLHLFVVATGLGGWAAGRILHLRQSGTSHTSEDLVFEPLRVLPLSWLWNTSHLVRAMPLPLADGGMVLPAYFELGLKYPLALRFDADGQFRGMVRMSQRTDLLQPTLLARSETEWLALLRDNSPRRKLRAVQTLDGGRHWQDLPDPGQPNPDAAVAALALQSGRMFMAHNPQAESREQLALSTSADGLHWTQLELLAQGGSGSEFSYPSMAWADGSLWVSYTEQRQRIAWQRFVFLPAMREGSK